MSNSVNFSSLWIIFFAFWKFCIYFLNYQFFTSASLPHLSGSIHAKITSVTICVLWKHETFFLNIKCDWQTKKLSNFWVNFLIQFSVSRRPINGKSAFFGLSRICLPIYMSGIAWNFQAVFNCNSQNEHYLL